MVCLNEKNRHIVEVGKTIMFAMNVPRFDWLYAVLTGFFLIQCMPSIVLHGQTPFFKLFHNSSPFLLPPRYFWYFEYHKWYVCYPPILKLDFVSANVTFFEDESYFTASSPLDFTPFARMPKPNVPVNHQFSYDE
ncbi:uncharacterized protein [Aristolochia californica]|uniref:uncharacterized protein n=1 Tax=Aristolochia californica TaxID=171875 RepID=UPI0035DD24B3